MYCFRMKYNFLFFIISTIYSRYFIIGHSYLRVRYLGDFPTAVYSEMVPRNRRVSESLSFMCLLLTETSGRTEIRPESPV